MADVLRRHGEAYRHYVKSRLVPKVLNRPLGRISVAHAPTPIDGRYPSPSGLSIDDPFKAQRDG
jgi:hypothetical protein